ncbi:MAG: bifunctional nuclease family protein [Candidatus Omnitrophica bacterium]|nr:bifunctional nuclease family protein [Candidatus Omnitrophota bacterium]MBU4479265.1 bifunctional nuclease family protein [Candidatus Omnitrophota bacterium]MCG2703059.1 bifunctional nuclease family protein [Candidatus Omnitrophota bacterium]
MVSVGLSKIIMHENKQDQVIILKEKDGERQIPIIIGLAEAAAIKMKVSNIMPPRPLTHDLLSSLIEKLGARLEKVIINKLEHNTFYARLILIQDGEKIIEADARPSDSIALALRLNAPIFVEEEVFKKLQFLNG